MWLLNLFLKADFSKQRRANIPGEMKGYCAKEQRVVIHYGEVGLKQSQARDEVEKRSLSLYAMLRGLILIH